MLGLKLNHVSKRSYWCRWMNWRVWVNESCLTNLITNSSSTAKPRAHVIHNAIEQRPVFIIAATVIIMSSLKIGTELTVSYNINCGDAFCIANTMSADIWRHKERGHQQPCYWPNNPNNRSAGPEGSNHTYVFHIARNPYNSACGCK